MFVNTENMLFSLLRSQICTTKANDSLPSSVTEEELSALYALAHRHNLAHIIAQALSRHHLLGHGGTVTMFGKRWRKQHTETNNSNTSFLKSAAHSRMTLSRIYR